MYAPQLFEASPFFYQLTEFNDQVVFNYSLTDQQFTYLNPAFENVFAQIRSSLKGTESLLAMLHPEDAPYVGQVYERLLAGEIIGTVELRIVLADQSQHWLRVKPFLLEGPATNQSIAGYVEDITDYKEYRDVETRFSNKKNAILQILSHDLAAPLGSIQALSHLVATRIKPYKDEQLEKVIDLIVQTSQHGVRLIADFIDQEFLESSEVTLMKGRFNLVEKIQEVIDAYQNAQREGAKTFQLVALDPYMYVELDEVKFIQVITNLISNAIKFTADDGVITVTLEDRDDKVLITVEDNGIGIPQKYHGRLFEKFTKARRPGLRNEPSVGLGMSLIKLIVEWHQGRIWFESQENKGTKFFIELPWR
jgi:two-component system sensor histidine kinase VicK